VRVLQVFYNINLGGAETTIMNYYRNIDRSKVQFDFLLIAGGQNKNYYEDEVISLGARVFRIVKKSINPLRDRNFPKAFARLIEENPEIKVVHIHISDPITAGVIAFWAMRNGIEVRIHHIHTKVRKLTLAQKKSLPFVRAVCTNILGCSNEVGEAMFGVKKWQSSKKAGVLLNSRELELFRYDPKKRQSTRKELGIDDEMAIISVASLYPVKNHFFLLDVFYEVLKESPDAVLLLAGDGILREELESKVAELGIEDSVLFLGFRDNIAELLQAADVFVLPSLFEGLPGAAIEAQAAGLLCLLSNNISSEAKIIDSAKFLPIDQGVKPWKEALLSCKNFNRFDTLQIVQDAGYEIDDAAKKLADLYLCGGEYAKN